MKSKGFTLIELLVVIAIIGILASIVFVNISSSRNQAKDAAIKADLDSMRVSAEQIYETQTDGYYTVCNDPNSISGVSYSAASGNAHEINNSKGNCVSTKYKWAACVFENIAAGKAWCIDNTGIAKEITAIAGGEQPPPKPVSCDTISPSSPACP